MKGSGAEKGAFVYEPADEFVERSNVYRFMQRYDIEDFEELHRRSTTAIDGVEASGLDWFWDTIIDELGIEFDEPYEMVRDDSDGPQFTDWYVGGRLNVAHNVLDRHVDPDNPTRNRVACIWEAEDGTVREVTYHELHRAANRVANALEERAIGTGDTVALYMPMVPEVVAILYGCFKVGAIAVPIFSGFGVDAIATRIKDAESRVLFTADGFTRRGDVVELKGNADRAIEEAGHVEHTIVLNHLEIDVASSERDETWSAAVDAQPSAYETKSLPADQACLLMYSSGTTGKPKGIVQTHAGALVQPAKEIYFAFDHKPADRFFWVSDIGWMMGPWMLLGNHTFGGTVFMYEGAPDHPAPDRFWRMIDRHGLTVFGISPTAIRALQKYGDEWVEGHDLSTLRLLGSTGEPWDPDSWMWFYRKVGGGDTPIMNISGGTEIFGCFLQPLPIHPLKPCTLGGPALGMDVDIVDESGESIVEANARGYLVARSSAPSMTKSLWQSDDRYLAEYWSRFDDSWNHGDWAQMDEDGCWFLHGRSDDVLNVAGRKIGPAEIEGALIDHQAVNAAAVVGVEDSVTGSAVVAYVILNAGAEGSDELREELRAQVADKHGKPFRPREIEFVDELPVTQSGKIVRRIVEAVHAGRDVGDVSSIENPGVIDRLADER